MDNLIKNVIEPELNNANAPIEKCVICGADTPYRFSTPISQRVFYVEESVQICQHCPYEIHQEKQVI